MSGSVDAWPELPYAAWKETAATLQLWTQIVGKVRLALTPWLNHSWHVTLYVTARGLGTGPMPTGNHVLEIDFDLLAHVLWLRLSDGRFRQVMLKPMTVAEFYVEVMAALRALGVEVGINEMPNEIADAVHFPMTRSTQAMTRRPLPASTGCCCRATRCLRTFAPAFSAR